MVIKKEEETTSVFDQLVLKKKHLVPFFLLLFDTQLIKQSLTDFQCKTSPIKKKQGNNKETPK